MRLTDLTVMLIAYFRRSKIKLRDTLFLCIPLCVGYDLFFRAVSSQVFSALQSLTSVFGMGTGGPFALKTLTDCSLRGLYQLSPSGTLLFTLIGAIPDAWGPVLPAGAPSGIRTRDPLIKSQLLYQLS